MTALTILTDSDVRNLLHALSRADILELQQSLADSLHLYSIAVEEASNRCSASQQPKASSLRRKDGRLTLFMPASSNDGVGVKMITLDSPCPSVRAKGLNNPSQTSVTTSLEALSVTSSDSSSTSAGSFQAAPSVASIQSTAPRGSLTLLDEAGNPKALINAEELTAFRTALAATMIFKKRSNVHDVTIFGAGKQAYWHARLALLLRGPDIHHLNIINRTFERAKEMVISLYDPPGVTDASELARPKVSIITPIHNEYERLLKSTVRASAAIFLTTPSTEPLFPASYLTSTEGRKKGRYISCIGSYRPEMIELHPDILRQAVVPDHASGHSGHHGHHTPHVLQHKHAQQGGAIIVDSVESCLREAGEIVQAGLKATEVVELGELVMLKRDAEKRRAERDHGLDSHGIEINSRQKDDTDSLKSWLDRGNVIYKSVGLGLMDVVVGGDLVRLSRTYGIGTRIENF